MMTKQKFDEYVDEMFVELKEALHKEPKTKKKTAKKTTN